MTGDWLVVGHRLDGVVLSGVIAVMASFLALEIASRVHDVCSRAMRAMWLGAGALAGDQVVDVQFADFVRDPFTTIRSLYRRLGRELEPVAEQRMREHVGASRALALQHFTEVDGVDSASR